MSAFNKVAIVGAGYVGSSAAFSLLHSKVVTHISLIDINKEKAYGEMLDLREATPFGSEKKIESGDSLSLCKGAGVVVITAGANRKPGESRLDLAAKNAKILVPLIQKVAKEEPDAIVLVVSNPVDVITYLAQKTSGIPEGRIFGSGTILDSARFRFFVGEQFGVSPTDVEAMVLGEHGDSSFAAVSFAKVNGAPLTHHSKYSQKLIDELMLKTKKAGQEIISRKGATYYAIARAIYIIVEAIFEDQNKVLPLSTTVSELFGVSDVSLGVPCIVSREGIKQAPLSLSLDERERFRTSAAALHAVIEQLKN